MSNFIYNNSGVPIDKINLGPLPPGANPRQWAVAAEWKTICQALLDIQAFCRGAAWMGFQANGVDPVPPGIDRYLWIRADGALMKTILGVATVVSGGGIAGRVVTIMKGLSGGGGYPTNIPYAQGLFFVTEDLSSVAANRFAANWGNNAFGQRPTGFTCRYDGTISRWVPISFLPNNT